MLKPFCTREAIHQACCCAVASEVKHFLYSRLSSHIFDSPITVPVGVGQEMYNVFHCRPWRIKRLKNKVLSKMQFAHSRHSLSVIKTSQFNDLCGYNSCTF